MVTYRRPNKTWVAKDAQILIANAGHIVVQTAGGFASLSGCFTISGISIEAATKNVTITPPETAWEKLDLLGQDATAFQNQLLDEKPVGIATITGTLIVGEDEVIEDMLSGITTTVTVGSTTFSRRQLGVENTSTWEVSAIVFNESPSGSAVGSKYNAYMVDNAKFSKWGDIKIGGADGHWEQDFTLVCLAKDFRYEFKN